MRYVIDLLWHYLSANSRHGTHSPFVYKLADNIIYNANSSIKEVRGVGQKPNLLIQEVATYLYSEMNLSYLGEVNDIPQLDIKALTVEDLLDYQKIYPLLFVKDIYDSTSSKVKWSALKADLRVQLTIDLFYFGLVIARSEQPKQNFKLRFPYSKY